MATSLLGGKCYIEIYAKYFFQWNSLFFPFQITLLQRHDHPPFNGNEIFLILQDKIRRAQNIAGHLHFAWDWAKSISLTLWRYLHRYHQYKFIYTEIGIKMFRNLTYLINSKLYLCIKVSSISKQISLIKNIISWKILYINVTLNILNELITTWIY